MNLIVYLRGQLTPEFGKRSIVCLFMLALLLMECVSSFFFRPGAEKGT